MSTKSRSTKSVTNSTSTPLLDRTISKTAVIGILVVTSLLAVAVFFLTGGIGGKEDKNKASVQYLTGRGAGDAGVADTPLTIKVRMPWLDGTPGNMLSGVTLQLLDESGQPAEFGGRRDPLPMRATIEIEVWEYAGSFPSKPGTYHAQVQLLPFTQGAQAQTLDLRDTPLHVVADTLPPIKSGYVLARENDLWILSTDGSRERRLTFFTPSYSSEKAADPAWSPDGKAIAFARTPGVTSGEIPRSEIWTIDEDGANLRKLVAHGPDEELLAPAWSSDGKYLYFTVETTPSDPSSTQGIGYRTDRLDIATGVRSHAVEDAEMASGGPEGELVYLENVKAQEAGTISAGRRIVIAEADQSQKRVIISETQYPILYAPRMSPDGKWLVFASVNQSTPPTPAGFNLLKWLMLEPETASAHGIPWELYIVPTAGGTPSQLTNLSDDEPYPIWHDNSTLSFLGLKGLYTLSIDAQGKAIGEPKRLAEGVQHGKLTWRGP
jgi:Tol biopolymer transport system component